jgi:hypothetical protein
MIVNKLCLECGKIFNKKSFWKYKTKKGLEPLYANTCQYCMVSHMDFNNIETILPYMKEFDVPYIPSHWENYAKQVEKRGKIWVFGAYLGCMKLASFKDFSYDDTELLNV